MNYGCHNTKNSNSTPTVGTLILSAISKTAVKELLGGQKLFLIKLKIAIVDHFNKGKSTPI